MPKSNQWFWMAGVIAIVAGATAQPCVAQNAGERKVKDEIEAILKVQDEAWNAGDIEAFMQTYWKSEQLTFSGGGKTVRGWQATLDRYRKSYPREKMGKLRFDNLEVSALAESAALVLGNWYLEQGGQQKEGNFSLVMKKIDGQWKIIHDHSSTLEKQKGWLTVEQATVVGRNHFRIPDNVELKTKEVGHYLILAVDVSNGKSGFEWDDFYVNRKTGKTQRTRPNFDEN